MIPDVLDIQSFSTQYFFVFTGVNLLRYFEYVDNVINTLASSILVTTFTWKLTKYARTFFNKEYLPTDKKAVLITGTDKGLTNEVAIKLNEQGFRVYATVMDIKGAGVKYMKENCRYEDRMIIKEMDVTKEDQIIQMAKEIRAELETNGEVLWAVVNGAEVREFGHTDWSDFSMFAKIFNVNTLGTVRVVRAFLPLLRQSKGRIINVESIAGRLTLPSLTAYCMTKSANLSFSDALRRQLKNWGINVTTIELAYDREFTSDNTTEPTDKLTKSIREQWKGTSQIVKEIYGDQYMEQLIISKLGKLAGWFKNDHNQVMDSFVDAVRGQELAIRYMPYTSIFAKMFATLSQFVPTEWLDYYYHNSEKGLPKPLV